MIRELRVYGVNIILLAGRDQLAYLSKLAVDRFKRNESFSDNEIFGYLGAVEKVLGNPCVLAVIKLAKEINARYNGQITFNMAMVEAIYSTLKLGGTPENYGEASSQ